MIKALCIALRENIISLFAKSSYMLVFMSSFTAGHTAESDEIFEIAVIFMTIYFSAPANFPGQE